jgi:hypothetical protein
MLGFPTNAKEDFLWLIKAKEKEKGLLAPDCSHKKKKLSKRNVKKL